MTIIIMFLIVVCLNIFSAVICLYCQKYNLIQDPLSYWLIGSITTYLCAIVNFMGTEKERRKNEK